MRRQRLLYQGSYLFSKWISWFALTINEDSHKFETPLGVVSFIFTIFRFSYISKRKMVFFIWININFLLSIELIIESLTPSAACSRAEK